MKTCFFLKIVSLDLLIICCMRVQCALISLFPNPVVSATFGAKLTLTCEYSPASSLKMITWTQDNRSTFSLPLVNGCTRIAFIPPAGFEDGCFKVGNTSVFTLIILNASRSDHERVWQCIATDVNRRDHHSHTTTIVVKDSEPDHLICNIGPPSRFVKLESAIAISLNTSLISSSEEQADQDTVLVYEVMNKMKSVLMVICIDGECSVTEKYRNYTIEYIAPGKIKFAMSNVSKDDAGEIRIIDVKKGHVIQCFSLYVVGPPTLPYIHVNDTPEEGGNVTLDCFSTSTTVPDNHGLPMLYSWSVNGTNNPNDDRYVYSHGNQTLTIKDITRSDADSHISCTAAEYGIGVEALSSTGPPTSLSVYYGPNELSLTPAKYLFIQNENKPVPYLLCSAVCHPECSYSWTKHVATNVVSNTGLLALGTLHRSEAGLYYCVARNPKRESSLTTQKAVAVFVRYGPDSLSLSTNRLVTLKQGTIANNITCVSECFPTCSYTWISIASNTIVTTDGVLSLGIVSWSHAGYYRCTATNTAPELSQSVSTDIHITVEPPDDVPEVITIVGATVGTLVVVVVVCAVTLVSVYRTRDVRHRSQSDRGSRSCPTTACSSIKTLNSSIIRDSGINVNSYDDMTRATENTEQAAGDHIKHAVGTVHNDGVGVFVTSVPKLCGNHVPYEDAYCNTYDELGITPCIKQSDSYEMIPISHYASESEFPSTPTNDSVPKKDSTQSNHSYTNTFVVKTNRKTGIAHDQCGNYMNAKSVHKDV